MARQALPRSCDAEQPMTVAEIPVAVPVAAQEHGRHAVPAPEIVLPGVAHRDAHGSCLQISPARHRHVMGHVDQAAVDLDQPLVPGLAGLGSEPFRHEVFDAVGVALGSLREVDRAAVAGADQRLDALDGDVRVLLDGCGNYLLGAVVDAFRQVAVTDEGCGVVARNLPDFCDEGQPLHPQPLLVIVLAEANDVAAGLFRCGMG